MGATCPSAFRRAEQDASLPVFNMVVVGFKSSGKSSIISRLGPSQQRTEQIDNSLGKAELDIGSFVLEKRLKMVTFEVSSSIIKTWKRYYPNANILLLVLDTEKLNKNPQSYSNSIHQILEDIDKHVSQTCKIIIAFNKIDQVRDKKSIGQGSIVQQISNLNHQVLTLKCSGLTGQGIDKLSKSILTIHKQIMF